MPDIILASTSPYRRELLARLQLPFTVESPAVDEQLTSGEAPRDRASRLAEAKARAVSQDSPQSIVIGSDQVAHLDDRIFRKPGNHENAHDQLAACSGQTVIFSTALSLVSGDRTWSTIEDYKVRFRRLTRAQIEQYLILDKPYDCAGSFKAEGLGITLLESTYGRDINALYGLPLIALIDGLTHFGYSLDTLTLRPK